VFFREFSRMYGEDIIPPRPEEEYSAYALRECAEGREPMPEYDWYCNHVFARYEAIPEEEAVEWEHYLASRHW